MTQGALAGLGTETGGEWAPNDGSGPTGDESVCPRCHTSHSGRFYGPCQACREELRTTMSIEARTVDVAEYEPKMNVTPNAVALKDD